MKNILPKRNGHRKEDRSEFLPPSHLTGSAWTFALVVFALTVLTPVLASATAWAAGQTFLADSASQDALTGGYTWYLEKADSLSPLTFWFFVRITILLIAQTVVCGAIFANSRNSMPHGILVVLEWLASLVVFFLVMQLPLGGISMSSTCKGFVLAVCIFVIGILPWRLSWLLVPTAGHRKIVAVVIYSALAILFIIQFLR